MAVKFEEASAMSILDCLLPSPEWRTLAGISREVYSGRVELPVWGVVRSDAPAGAPIEIQVVTTVQACDANSCLAPSEIELAGELFLAD